MKIYEDVANKEGAHVLKNNMWVAKGIEVVRVPLPCGDYIAANEKVEDVINRKAKRGVALKKMDFLGTYNVSVDSKENMLEIVGNICGKSHERFRDECILAQNNGIKLYILIENEDGITSLDGVFKWQNPRMHNYNKVKHMHNIGKWMNVKLPKAPPTSGVTLAKAMISMEKKYGVQFQFCKPEESADRILRLLGVF